MLTTTHYEMALGSSYERQIKQNGSFNGSILVFKIYLSKNNDPNSHIILTE